MCDGEVEATAFCHLPFLPHAPRIDAPFPLFLPVRAQRANGGQLRDLDRGVAHAEKRFELDVGRVRVSRLQAREDVLADIG